MNKECYKFEELNYKKGIFDFVDVTYIITMVNSWRHKNIYDQIKKYKLTSKIIIVFNSGYKKCNKNKLVQSSSYDLLDCYYNIFLHSQKNNYKNIFILEDDFILSDRIKEKKVGENIKTFFLENENLLFTYSLGSLPTIIYPYDKNSNYIYGLGTHCIIYPKQTITHLIKILKKMYEKNNLIDYDILTNFNVYRINYKEPLCVQTFPNTENFNNWPKIGQLYMKLLRKLLNIDKKESVFAAYKSICKINKIIYYILFILACIILYILYSKFLK